MTLEVSNHSGGARHGESARSPGGLDVAGTWLKVRQRLRKYRRTALYIWVRHRPLPRKRPLHDLPAPLIVTLTSYPLRFRFLAATLRSLLSQSVAPDKLILWVTHDDRPKLPPDVLALQKCGLTICATTDLGSYTKIIPALTIYPDAFLITADDDLYYENKWLECLVSNYSGNFKEIICWKAHKIALDEDGKLLPYRQWEMNTPFVGASSTIFPTGCAGVLYPPRCFHKDVTRSEIFKELAPTADDIWLYWMARMNNSCFRRVGPRKRLVTWPGSQVESLWSQNQRADGGNDDQIGHLTSKYGLPF